MAGLFPPNSNNVGVKCCAAAVATTLPTSVLPVKTIASNRCLRSSVECAAPPKTTDTTRGSTY
eukprot:10535148-Ditylum_brightwellii.AAC.1